MQNWKKMALTVILITVPIIVILGVVAMIQKAQRTQVEKETQVVEMTLGDERAQADQLLERATELRTLSDDLVLPQVQINIRL